MSEGFSIYTTIFSIISATVYDYLEMSRYGNDCNCCLHLNANDLQYQFFIFDEVHEGSELLPT
jgi:hypothetical protein